MVSQLRTSVKKHAECLHGLERFSATESIIFVLNRSARAEVTGYQSNWV